ncbi:uncharacterized protein LOC114354537 [Ostrinia furnacalis]|uniref:uncharacterized protein LOC114354537 n=1 Tax=Ostrinia furnacalis TaxID=93504 RepID=UPI00103F7AE6|nr:uncharacterized protein LOC114354537 [Ostrinia furnacalis]
MAHENWSYSPSYTPLSPPASGRMSPTSVQRIINNMENENQRYGDIIINQQKKLYSSIRTVSHGAKVIRIEIYDAEQFENSTKSVCQCNAEICAQHVVENVFNDNIYTRVKDIIKSIGTIFMSQPF